MNIGQTVFCKSESVYSIHLTKGNEYKIYDVGTNSKEGKIRIKGDKDKLVWICNTCFSINNIPSIYSIIFDDEIQGKNHDYSEVTIEFENQRKRWLTFMTLRHLNKLLNQNRKFISGNKLIFVKEISKSNIIKTIETLDKQNELIENTQSY